jgi:hypothetical protein
MHQYRPPEQDPKGSWTEIATITWVILGLLAPPLLAIFAVLFLLGSAVWLLSYGVVFSLIPIAILGLGVWRLIELDKRAAETFEEDLFGRRRP